MKLIFHFSIILVLIYSLLLEAEQSRKLRINLGDCMEHKDRLELVNKHIKGD